MNTTPHIPCSPGAFTDPGWTILSTWEQRPRPLNGTRPWVWCCHVIPCGHLTVDWEGLFRSTHLKDNNKALHMAQAFVTQVQNTLAVQRTEPQHQALKEWTYPDWFTSVLHKGKVHAVPKKSECPFATSSGHSVDGPTDLATTPSVPGVAPAAC